MRKAKIAKREVCLLLTLMCVSIGCRHVSRTPAEPMRHPVGFPIDRRDFRASVEEAWAATLHTVKMSDGIIILEDRDSRRIIYGIFDKRGRQRVEVTVLLKDRTSDYGFEITTVFLGLRGGSSGSYSIITEDFFKKLRRSLTKR